MKRTDPAIIVKEEFKTTKETLWKAITDINEMQHWYFTMIPDFAPTVGFKTEFEVSVENRTFTHVWEVTEVIPNKMITYIWTYLEYPGKAAVSFELLEKEGGLQLVLTLYVLENFPEDIPEFRRESCIHGWEYFLQGNLKDYMTHK